MRRRFPTLRRFVPELLVLFVVATTPRIGIVVHHHADGGLAHLHLGATVGGDDRGTARVPHASGGEGPTLAAVEPALHVHWQQPFAVAALPMPVGLAGPDDPEAGMPRYPAPCLERPTVSAAARAPPPASSSVDR